MTETHRHDHSGLALDGTFEPHKPCLPRMDGWTARKENNAAWMKERKNVLYVYIFLGNAITERYAGYMKLISRNLVGIVT